MKQMEVTIMGQSYLLGGPEGGEAALTVAAVHARHGTTALLATTMTAMVGLVAWATVSATLRPIVLTTIP